MMWMVDGDDLVSMVVHGSSLSPASLSVLLSLFLLIIAMVGILPCACAGMPSSWVWDQGSGSPTPCLLPLPFILTLPTP